MKKSYEIKRTQTLVFIALISALITATTVFFQVPFVNGGYFNLGDTVILILSSIAPARYVMVAAGLGSALADVLSGYALYAIFTAFIKAGEVFVFYSLRGLLKTKLYPAVFLASAVFMVFGYGIVDRFILGSYGFFASVTTNALQGVVAFIVPTLAYPLVRKFDINVKGLIT